MHDGVGQINYAACQTEGETLLYHGDAEREMSWGILGQLHNEVVYNLIGLCLEYSYAHSGDGLNDEFRSCGDIPLKSTM